MTVQEAIERIGSNATRTATGHAAALRGIRAAQRGTVRINASDDGLPVFDKSGPAVIPAPDEAGRHLRGYLEAVKQADSALVRLAAYTDLYERLGLEPLRDDWGNIVTQDPGRWATPDEQKLVRMESIDDDECISCRRIPNHYSLALSGGLCGRCKEDLAIAKAILVEQGDQKRADKLSLPPASIVEQRARGKNVRLNGNDFRAALAPNAAKRASKKKVAAGT